MTSESVVEMFIDGACRGNPGPGGWGVVLRMGMHEKELSGVNANTTNNRMELQAAIEGLAYLRRACKVHATTDSQYVRKGITEWLPAWQKRGWKTSAKKPVKNIDLWKRLAEEAGRHQIEWHWVRGHTGHAENERADALARDAISKMMLKS